MTAALVSAYFALFLFAALRSRQYQWILGTLFLTAGFTLIASRLLTLPLGAYLVFRLPYLSISLAGFFFFLLSWRYRRGSGFYGLASDGLCAFAVAGMMQHLAFLLILGLASLFDTGISERVYEDQIMLYLWRPAWWVTVHSTLSVILLLTCPRADGRIRFRAVDLEAIFLSALLINAFAAVKYLADFLSLFA